MVLVVYSVWFVEVASKYHRLMAEHFPYQSYGNLCRFGPILTNPTLGPMPHGLHIPHTSERYLEFSPESESLPSVLCYLLSLFQIPYFALNLLVVTHRTLQRLQLDR